MRGGLRNGRLHIKVIAVFLPLFLLTRNGSGGDHAFARKQLAHAGAASRVLARGFGNNIARTRQCILRRQHSLFLIEERLRHIKEIAPRLFHQTHRQRLKPLFAGNGRARMALGAIGKIQVLQRGERLRRFN